MSDRLFFPTTLLVGLLLVAVALLPALNRKPTGSVSFTAEEAANGYSRLVIDGEELYKIIAAGEARISFFPGPDGQTQLALSADKDMLGDDPLKVPHFRLAGDVERVLSGKRIRISIDARPGGERGAEAIRVNYSAGREGGSGWAVLPLQRGFSDVAFGWNVPGRRNTDLSVDYLAIAPVVPDKAREVIIRRITIEWLGDEAE